MNCYRISNILCINECWTIFRQKKMKLGAPCDVVTEKSAVNIMGGICEKQGNFSKNGKNKGIFT